ncbi:hypothetical protein ES703_84446 [subsurface metagenome]
MQVILEKDRDACLSRRVDNAVDPLCFGDEGRLRLGSDDDPVDDRKIGGRR